MQQFTEVFKVSESLTVEISRQKTQPKRGFKQLLQWGVKSLIRYQLGALIGNLGAVVIPGLAINAAQLIALLVFQAILFNPGSEAMSLSILGLAIGVICNV